MKNYFVNAQGYSDMEAHNMANQHLTTNDAYGLGYNVYSVPEGQYMIGTNGKLNPNATLGNVVNYNGQDYMLLPDDWTDAAYKTGLRQCRHGQVLVLRFVQLPEQRGYLPQFGL